MYAVVGCGECSALWVVEGEPETSRCPRCGTRRPFAKRKTFVETDDPERARAVRATMLASRRGDQADEDLAAYADQATAVEDGVVDDDEYLRASGLDAEAVADAGDRDPRGTVRTGSTTEIVVSALDALERPTEEAVIEYATERGVSASDARTSLAKLVRRGEASENRGRYRRL